MLAVRILSKEAGVDLHTREAVSVRRELRHLLLRKAGADRQALEGLAFVHQALEALAVLGRDLHDRREPVDGGLEIGDLAWGDLERVGGIVVGEDDSVPVQDEPAVRHHGYDGNAVVLRECVVIVVLYHLHVKEAREQYREQSDNHNPRDGEPHAKAGELDLRVAYFYAARHRTNQTWSASVLGFCGMTSVTVSNGQSIAATTGPRKYSQPGNSAPSAMRTSSMMSFTSCNITST